MFGVYEFRFVLLDLRIVFDDCVGNMLLDNVLKMMCFDC